jgi:hypothetical protein
MLERTHITIETAVEEIQSRLAKMICSENKDLIAKTIIQNLKKTDRGLIQLYKAFTGIEETTELYPLQEVEVDVDALSTWRMDKDEMIKRKMIFQGRVRATIEKIDLTSNYPIRVKYFYLDSDHEKKVDTYWVSEKSIKILPDFEKETEIIIPKSEQ